MTCVKEKTGVVVKGKQVECLKRWKHTRHPPLPAEKFADFSSNCHHAICTPVTADSRTAPCLVYGFLGL